MSNRRPTPELIRARKHEIKLRYERKTKVNRRSRGMAAIRISDLMRWLFHVYGPHPELEPCDHSVTIARIFVHHLIGLAHGDRRASDWLRAYCPTMTPRDRERLISEATHCPLKWSADKLAWKLRITDAVRSALRITTIGAIDCNRDQRKARDRKRRAEREKARREAKRTNRVPTI